MSDIANRLAQPFDPALVSWRLGPTNREKTKGMALAYIDARDVMRRLDDVCGPQNWQDEYPWSDGKRVVCRIGIRIGDEWIWKTDGAGDTDTEGEKGALSDAFKRSAVKWGVGRYLYDVKSPWIEIEQKGNSYVIKDGEYAKLRNSLPKPQRAQVAANAGGGQQTPFDDPAPARPQNLNVAALPPNPEEPPEVTASRERIRQLISKYNGIIKTAPTRNALELSFDDGREELAEIAAAGINGHAAATELRDRYMRRMSQFSEGKAA